jgi:putative tryptophan/tyrosine transport system substrate-binding protein
MRASALTTYANPWQLDYLPQILRVAALTRLPAIYPNRDHVEAGGLMPYGTNWEDFHRRAAFYVDKIIKGAKPADLPVEQPTKFELVINLKAAKQIGVTIPPQILMDADRIIR